ncbi:hypothetical protein [Pedobacter arcticus]|uniref:hypothetical protein n=1 Tax=Pedobacter arcticus TaxID=752140 RepID=UPI000363C81D|nr:hypothetical protein [Pedobacter arcticus]
MKKEYLFNCRKIEGSYIQRGTCATLQDEKTVFYQKQKTAIQRYVAFHVQFVA